MPPPTAPTQRRPLVPLALITLLLAIALLYFTLTPARTNADDEPPSDLCILIVVDTLRRDALSCYGAPLASTPAIDALAADALRFEQAIATSCWTLPSVASLLTGTWPELHKAGGQNVQLTPLSPDVACAAELFHAHGFRTLALVNAAFLHPALGLARGFDQYEHFPAYNDEIVRADEVVRRALAHLEDPLRGSTFLFIHLFDPHLDYDPPSGAHEPFTLAQGRALAAPGERPSAAEIARVRELYTREVVAVDAAIDTLLDGLQQRGLYEAATLVLTSDHGEEFWEHGRFEHGHAMYDELIRVPLILKLPDTRAIPAAIIAQQVRLIDVLPTLLELYAIDPPTTVEGRSILALDALAPLPAFSQDPLYGSDLLSWRTERWHYIHDRGADATKRGWLFDLTADPTEQRDLFDELPETADALYRELATFWNDLRARGELHRDSPPLDLSPKRLDSLRDSLESLGYTDRDD